MSELISDEMVKKVRSAIIEARLDHTLPYNEHEDLDDWVARAALQAALPLLQEKIIQGMTEPTLEMIHEGTDVGDDEGNRWERDRFGTADRLWRAMLRAYARSLGLKIEGAG